MQVWSNRPVIRLCWAAALTLAACRAGAWWLTPPLRSSAHDCQHAVSSTANATEVTGPQSYVIQAQFSAINPLARGNPSAMKPTRLPTVEVARVPQRLPPVAAPLANQRLPPVDVSSEEQLPPATSMAENFPPSSVEQDSPSDPVPDLIPIDALSVNPQPSCPMDIAPHDLQAQSLQSDVPADEDVCLDEKPAEATDLLTTSDLPIDAHCAPHRARDSDSVAQENLPTDTDRALPSPNEVERELPHDVEPTATIDVPLHHLPELNSPADTPIATPSVDAPVATANINPGTAAFDPKDPLQMIPVDMRHDWNDPGSGLHVAARQACQLVRDASTLASRGATFSARRELESALVILSQALDSNYSTTAFTQCLRSGLLAMEEASDFAPSNAQGQLSLDVALIASRHRSRAICAEQIGRCTPIEAARKYHSFAQVHLAASCGGSPVAAHAFFGLGKVYGSMFDSDSSAERRYGQRAMLLHRTVLMIDDSNSSAATELGALLARFGRLKEARDTLRHGLSRSPSPETWSHLANVHAQLGEVELAKQAHAEWNRITQLARSKHPATITAPNGMTVKWVDKETFEQASRELKPRSSTEPMPAQILQTAVQPERSRNAW